MVSPRPTRAAPGYGQYAYGQPGAAPISARRATSRPARDWVPLPRRRTASAPASGSTPSSASRTRRQLHRCPASPASPRRSACTFADHAPHARRDAVAPSRPACSSAPAKASASHRSSSCTREARTTTGASRGSRAPSSSARRSAAPPVLPAIYVARPQPKTNALRRLGRYLGLDHRQRVRRRRSQWAAGRGERLDRRSAGSSASTSASSAPPASRRCGRLSWDQLGLDVGRHGHRRPASRFPSIIFYAGGDHDPRRGLIAPGRRRCPRHRGGRLHRRAGSPRRRSVDNAPRRLLGPKTRRLRLLGGGLMHVPGGMGLQAYGQLWDPCRRCRLGKSRGGNGCYARRLDADSEVLRRSAPAPRVFTASTSRSPRSARRSATTSRSQGAGVAEHHAQIVFDGRDFKLEEVDRRRRDPDQRQEEAPRAPRPRRPPHARRRRARVQHLRRAAAVAPDAAAPTRRRRAARPANGDRAQLAGVRKLYEFSEKLMTIEERRRAARGDARRRHRRHRRREGPRAPARRRLRLGRQARPAEAGKPVDPRVAQRATARRIDRRDAARISRQHRPPRPRDRAARSSSATRSPTTTFGTSESVVALQALERHVRAARLAGRRSRARSTSATTG